MSGRRTKRREGRFGRDTRDFAGNKERRNRDGQREFKLDQIFSQLIEPLLISNERQIKLDLHKTPARAHRAHREMLASHLPGARRRLLNGLTVFDHTGGGPIVVNGIAYCSVCAHHLLPFFGVAHVGYLPRTKIIGLSKIARVVDFFARQLQIQEVLADDIADFLQKLLDPIGVSVQIDARHLCVEARGVRKIGTLTTTRADRGVAVDLDLGRDLTSDKRRRS